MLYDTDLGLDQLCEGSESSSREKLETELRKLVSLLMNDVGNVEELGYINNLVFLGESAADSRLHDVLKNVPGEQYERPLAATGQSGWVL